MSIRAEKVGSTIKRYLAQPINEIANEKSAGLATVTTVRMTPDLQIARVFVSIYGKGSSPGDFIQELENRKGELRKIIGKNLKLRRTPDLQFLLDDTLDQIEHIQDLLDSAKTGDNNHDDNESDKD